MISVKQFLCKLPIGNPQGDTLEVKVLGIKISDLTGKAHIQHNILSAQIGHTDVLPLLESDLVRIYDGGGDFHSTILGYTEKAMHSIVHAHIMHVSNPALQIRKVEFTTEAKPTLEQRLLTVRAQYDLYKISLPAFYGAKADFYTCELNDLSIDGVPFSKAETELQLSYQTVDDLFDAFLDKMNTDTCKIDFEHTASISTGANVVFVEAA